MVPTLTTAFADGFESCGGASISLGGDSGGAVFSPPDSSGNIKAFGIMTAGQDLPGGWGELVYSPIDYIDDEVSIQLIL
jgi:hypothetical protein